LAKPVRKNYSSLKGGIQKTKDGQVRRGFVMNPSAFSPKGKKSEKKRGREK